MTLPCCELHSIVRYYLVQTGDGMSKNTSITLGKHFDCFIANQLDNGRFSSASEVVRAGLRMLEDNEHKVDTLRMLLEDGEKSGTAEYNYEKLMNELDDELG